GRHGWHGHVRSSRALNRAQAQGRDTPPPAPAPPLKTPPSWRGFFISIAAGLRQIARALSRFTSRNFRVYVRRIVPTRPSEHSHDGSERANAGGVDRRPCTAGAERMQASVITR